MAEVGGLQLKRAEPPAAPAPQAVAVASPPPLPAGGASPAPVSPTPLAGPPAAPANRGAQASHPDGFPPERDIGIPGRLLVWTLSLLIFGGGLAGWFLLFGYAEGHLDTLLAMGGMAPGEGAMNAMAATSLGGADPDDLAFLSQQLGLDPEMLGLSEDKAAPLELNPTPARRQAWPAITVTGIMAGARPADARVMLDGVLVRVGDPYRGVQVVEVNNNAAALRYKDEVIWLYSGQSTAD